MALAGFGKEYTVEINKYSHLIEKLSVTTNKSEILLLCQEFTRLMGFDWFLLGLCNPTTSLNEPDIQVITDYPEQWMALYNEKNFVNSDPVVAYALNHSVPIKWNKLIELAAYSDEKYLNMMKLTQQYGLRNGVSVPLKTQAGYFGVFSLAANISNEEFDELCEKAVADIQFFSSHAQEAVIAYLKAADQSEPELLRHELTKREHECLFWACEGKTAWEISVILEITERTVLFHLSNVTNKLGASNRQHAVAKALLLGIVKPNLDFIETD